MAGVIAHLPPVNNRWPGAPSFEDLKSKLVALWVCEWMLNMLVTFNHPMNQRIRKGLALPPVILNCLATDVRSTLQATSSPFSVVEIRRWSNSTCVLIGRTALQRKFCSLRKTTFYGNGFYRVDDGWFAGGFPYFWILATGSLLYECRWKAMGSSSSVPKADPMMEHQPYPDMNIIFRGIPKMIQVDFEGLFIGKAKKFLCIMKKGAYAFLKRRAQFSFKNFSAHYLFKRVCCAARFFSHRRLCFFLGGDVEALICDPSASTLPSAHIRLQGCRWLPHTRIAWEAS